MCVCVVLQLRYYSCNTDDGCVQVKRKGRSVHVEPVAGFNTERLKQLVQALLALQQHKGSDELSAPGAATTGPRAPLQLVGSLQPLPLLGVSQDHDKRHGSTTHVYTSYTQS